MTTTFRTAGAWGAGKGSNLTPAEVDTNFYDKETRITALEAAGVGVGIDSISVSGNQMTITLTDSSVQGPFTLPSATFTAKGAWQPSTLYDAFDIVTYNGSTYLVNFGHTSDTTFDAAASVTGTGDLYTLIWQYPATMGQEVSGATYTPVLLDANTYIRLTNAAGCAVSIDPAVEFADWTELTFRDASTDTGASCTFDISTPGSINGVDGHLNISAGQGSVVTLKKVGSTDAWDIMGRLATA